MQRVRFIPPALAIPAKVSPVGNLWIHEVKFDGWRVQVHRFEDQARLYSRQGKFLPKSFRTLSEACIYLPEGVYDGELVACDSDGKPCFDDIRAEHPNLCIWLFDLMQLKGEECRDRKLRDRREALRQLLIQVDDDRLRFSEEFSDPVKLLAVGESMGLEGVVSKRRDGPYRSGKTGDWIKVKTGAWREANKNRWENMTREKPTERERA